MRSDETHKTQTLWLTGVLHACTHLYQVALMPLYLQMQRDFGLQSVAQVTFLLTVLMIACCGPSYPIGILADRLNRKHLLTFGLVVNGAGFIALALAPNYVWAGFAVALAGFGGSFYHPAATAMIARLFPKTTGKALGLVGIGASVGFFLGPLYTGWRAAMLEPALGAAAWRRPVLELGLLGLVVAALFAWFAEHERPAPAAARQVSPRAEPIFPTFSLWLFFLAYCGAFSLRDFAGASMGSLGSLFLQKAHGYDPKWAGLALSAIFPAAVISNPLFGSLSDGGRKRWGTLLLTIAAAMVFLLPHVPAAWTFPVFLTYGFFFMASYPITEAALMESVPDSVRGRVFGLFVTVGGVIGNLSHWVVGAQVKRLGVTAQTPSAYVPLYNCLGVLLLCSMVGLLCVDPIRRREHVTPKAEEDSMPLLT